MNLTFTRHSSRPLVAVVARRTIAVRLMVAKSGLSPFDRFIAESIHPAPGHRLAISVVWRAWGRYAVTHGHDVGTCADLVSAVRKAHPEARKVKGRSGMEVHTGLHLSGVALP